MLAVLDSDDDTPMADAEEPVQCRVNPASQWRLGGHSSWQPAAPHAASRVPANVHSAEPAASPFQSPWSRQAGQSHLNMFRYQSAVQWLCCTVLTEASGPDAFLLPAQFTCQRGLCLVVHLSRTKSCAKACHWCRERLVHLVQITCSMAVA